MDFEAFDHLKATLTHVIGGGFVLRCVWDNAHSVEIGRATERCFEGVKEGEKKPRGLADALRICKGDSGAG